MAGSSTRPSIASASLISCPTTCATPLRRLPSTKAVQRMLGHASAKVTLGIHGGLFEEDLETLADTLEQRYG